MIEPEAQMRYQAVIASPLPDAPYLGLILSEGRLNAIDLLGPCTKPYLNKDEGVDGAVSLLRHYFSHPQLNESPLLQPAGTDFQQRVWLRLRRIPCGQVMRYGELARELGSSPRAVAGACRANPIPFLIPCHRVLAANGLGGYMGDTTGGALIIKQWLLRHEGYV